jgi:hypothetical protein
MFNSGNRITILQNLIILVYFFVKHKKLRKVSNDGVVVIHHRHVRDAETDNNAAGRPAAPNNGIVQRASLPHSTACRFL